jgi:hypothetical protein
VRTLRLVVLLALAPLAQAEAQVVRGKLLQAGSTAPLADAVVIAADSFGTAVAEARSSDAGVFFLDTRQTGVVRFLVRKVGVQPTESELVRLPAEADTVDIELSAPLFGLQLATVRVIGDRPQPISSFNQIMLREARQNGYRVIAPERVARERGTSENLGDLLRRLPLASVRPPDAGQGCYYYVRNGQCLSLVVDGQVLGPNTFVSANDVYFIALLTPSQSYVAYGPRARDGALLVVTRRQADEPPSERRSPPQP